MKTQFNQPQGSTAIEVNRQTLARIWGYPIRSTIYLNTYTNVTGSSIIFEPDTGTMWYTGTAQGTPVSWVVNSKSLTLNTNQGVFTCWPAIALSRDITSETQSIRSFTERADDIPSILDWDSDSSNDDSSRIIRAIADGIRTLYVPSTRTFNIGEIDINTNMLIYGNGISGYRQVGGKFVVAADAEYGFAFTGSGNGNAGNGNRVIGGGLSGLSIIGENSACAADMVRVLHASSHEFRNVSFRLTQGSAFTLEDFMESRIEACYMNNIGADGKPVIYIKDYVDSLPWNVNNLHIRENTFGSCSGNWIHMSDRSNADLIWIHGNKFEWDSTPISPNISSKAVIYAGLVERVSIKDNGFVYFYPAHNMYDTILELGANANYGVTFSDNMAWGCTNANYWKTAGGALAGHNNRSNAPMSTVNTSSYSQDIEEPIIRTSTGNKPTSYAAKKNDVEFISVHQLTGANVSNNFVVDADAVMYGTCMNTPASSEFRRAFIPKDMLSSGRMVKVSLRCKNVNSSGGQLQLLLNGNAITDSVSGQSTGLNYITIPANSGWKEYSWYLNASQLASGGALIFRNNSSVRFLFDGVRIEYARSVSITIPWSATSIPANTVSSTTLAMGSRLVSHIKGVTSVSANGSLGGAVSSAYLRASDNTLVVQLMTAASSATVAATSLTLSLILE